MLSSISKLKQNTFHHQHVSKVVKNGEKSVWMSPWHYSVALRTCLSARLPVRRLARWD